MLLLVGGRYFKMWKFLTHWEVGDYNNHWYLLSMYNVLGTVQALQIMSYLSLTSTSRGDSMNPILEMKSYRTYK